MDVLSPEIPSFGSGNAPRVNVDNFSVGFGNFTVGNFTGRSDTLVELGIAGFGAEIFGTDCGKFMISTPFQTVRGQRRRRPKILVGSYFVEQRFSILEFVIANLSLHLRDWKFLIPK